MVLYQIDVWKSVAYSPNPGGLYYWSSVYYADRADYASNTAMINRVRNCDAAITLADVTYVKYVLKSPPGRGNVQATILDGLNHGLQATDPDGYSMINICRVVTAFDDGTKSYRYAGRPMPARWVDGQKINSVGLLWIGGWVGSMRASSGRPPMRNLAGSPLVGGIVPDLLSQWQLRHGTMRRERVY